MKTTSMKKKVLHRHLDWVKYYKLLFGVNEKLLTQHISGPIAKYNLLPATRVGQRLGQGLGLGLMVSARG